MGGMDHPDTIEHLNLDPGEVLFCEGDSGTILYVVARGHLRVEKASGDMNQTVSVIGPGEFVGEMSALTGSRRSATVIAEDACDLMPYDSDTLEALILKSPTVALRIIRLLASRLAETTDRITLIDSALTQAD